MCRIVVRVVFAYIRWIIIVFGHKLASATATKDHLFYSVCTCRLGLYNFGTQLSLLAKKCLRIKKVFLEFLSLGCMYYGQLLVGRHFLLGL